ncbi:hypothetical protein QEJ31_01160 [Pigmentibacter sp. JX0631]|uniref:hypothetical protein n=1 Tax=Pigmentibacter sp. JX0631 TaxID=2976982 RepID=UPI0024696200|nr:hypothetical protein [Pigmentibacter sp. JX0631]WGL60212.1 hypothetical protein QEJ31_01160 [Pigmentibacter sp. JX0631]
MSFILSNYFSTKKNDIRPLHSGFGFFSEVIQKKLNSHEIKQIQSDKVKNNYLENKIETKNEIFADEHSSEIAIPLSENILNDSENSLNNKNLKKQHEKQKIDYKNSTIEKYYVNPFFAFLAWTIDALLGFCFLIISLCINFVFLPKGFFAISPSNAKILSFITTDMNMIYTFMFSLQVWLFMAFLVFLFQYSILGFEGSTLGRWIFGIAIKNHKNIHLKVSEKSKICAALSEAFLLGGILSFLFIVIFPSRVPIFFWLRYSSKK